MSSQGWAAALQGLQQGLKAGADARSEKDKLALEAALKMRQMQMEQQKIDLMKEEQANKDTTLIPDFLYNIPKMQLTGSKEDVGPTAPGSDVGLGSLSAYGSKPTPKENLPKEVKTGLAGLSPGQRIGNKLLEAVMPKKDSWESRQNNIDRRQENSFIEQQSKDFIHDAEKYQLAPIARGLENFDALTGLISNPEGNKENLAKIPQDASFIFENIPLGSNISSFIASKSRTPEEQEINASLYAMFNPQVRANSGMTVTSQEMVKNALEKARMGDPSVLAKIIRGDFDFYSGKLRDLKTTYPLARAGGSFSGEDYLNKINERRSGSPSSGGSISLQELAKKELARRGAIR